MFRREIAHAPMICLLVLVASCGSSRTADRKQPINRIEVYGLSLYLLSPISYKPSRVVASPQAVKNTIDGLDDLAKFLPLVDKAESAPLSTYKGIDARIVLLLYSDGRLLDTLALNQLYMSYRGEYRDVDTALLRLAGSYLDKEIQWSIDELLKAKANQ